jgi:predicted NBD/HSP70 family sugar kinase
MPLPYVLIGLDGGATKVSGWTIQVDQEHWFSLGKHHVQRRYRDYPHYIKDFQPVDLKTQLAEMASSTIRLTPAEKSQGQAYVEATADVVTELAQGQPVLLGMGMPGLKTQDKRGIAAMANGPRLPKFAQKVESLLQQRKVKLVAPLVKLGSDADYCGSGEEYSSQGLFRGVASAYYLGGGTGAADALKIQGRLLPFDEAKAWIAKTWELKNDRGISLERYASANGIQTLYGNLTNTPIETLTANQIFPEQILNRAVAGEKAAQETFWEVSHYLATLLYERILTLYAGWKGIFDFINPQRSALKEKHTFLGTLLDRIVIGQRLGNLMAQAQATPILWEPCMVELENLIQKSSHLDSQAKQHYLTKGKLRPGLVQISQLREAPALGAAIEALLLFKR